MTLSCDPAAALLARAEEQNRMLRDERDLLAAAWAYGDHLLSCSKWVSEDDLCDCGYQEMAAAVAERVTFADDQP